MITLLLAGLASVASATDLPLEEDIAAEVRALMPAVSTLRGLAFMRDVPVQFEAPDDIREQVLADTLDDKALEALERARLGMAMFRLAPPDFDLRANVVSVLTDRIGGYYDPDHLRLVLVRRPDAFTGRHMEGTSEDEMVAAHELVHALQDQHFDLWRLRHRDYLSDDVDTAVLALVEGDASFAMLHFMLADEDIDLMTMPPPQFDAVFVGDKEDGPFTGALGEMPRVLRDSLLFPYGPGTSFVQNVVRNRGWQGVDDAFRSPPLSTEHVLHPEKYLAGDDPPLLPELPDLSGVLAAGWSKRDDNVLGELGVRSLLRHHGQSTHGSARAAAGWGGNRYHLYQHEDGDIAGVWYSVWDSGKDRREFARALGGLPSHEGAWQVTEAGEAVIVTMDVPEPQRRRMLKRLRRVRHTPIQALDAVSTPREEGRAVSAPN